MRIKLKVFHSHSKRTCWGHQDFVNTAIDNAPMCCNSWFEDVYQVTEWWICVELGPKVLWGKELHDGTLEPLVTVTQAPQCFFRWCNHNTKDCRKNWSKRKTQRSIWSSLQALVSSLSRVIREKCRKGSEMQSDYHRSRDTRTMGVLMHKCWKKWYFITAKRLSKITGKGWKMCLLWMALKPGLTGS